MKYFSIVAIALIANLSSGSALKLISRDDGFGDEDDQNTTLASLKDAEHIHGKTYGGISKEDQKNVVIEKTKMNFSNDEFVKYEKRKFNSFLQLGADIQFLDQPVQMRPIGVAMA